MQRLKKSCAIEIKSSTLMSCLSLSTMTLLIFATVVMLTVINVTPIIILGIGELPHGQRDIIFEPRLQYLNNTELALRAGVPSMPRVRSAVKLNQVTTATAWYMDFQLEKQQHLGTLGGNQPINHSYVYAHEELNLKAGEKVNISHPHRLFLRALKKVINQDKIYCPQKQKVISQLNDIMYSTSFELRGEFTVKQVFDTAAGKFGIGQVNNYIYLDIRYALQQIINQSYIRANKNPEISALVKLLNGPFYSFGQFASSATVNLPNRIEVYSNPNYEESYGELNKVGLDLLNKIGMFSVRSQMPIASNLINLGYVGMFIGVMFKLIIFSLFLLSTLMMNNMFRMGVERKNFDFALLKVMGADRIFIVGNILAGALKYVAFANIIAYPLAYGALMIITGIFQEFFGYRHEIYPTADSIFGGIFIGVLVPIVSAIAPIWGVIRNDLAQNLNPLRNKTEAIKTEIYIEGREFPIGKLVFGILAASFGLMIYYLLPRALISQNLGLLLLIFFVILQGLLVGLILLSFSVQYIFQRAVAYICLFWVQATDFLLTLKNLSSHRFRNRRTAILYALSVSFIVFVSVGFQIQLQTIYTEMLKAKGSYIVIYAGDQGQRELFDEILGRTKGIEDWAYQSQDLYSYLNQNMDLKQVLVSDKARLFFRSNKIRAVSPNFINTFFYDKVSYVKSDASPPYDPYSYLYSENGLMTCTIGMYSARHFGILQGKNHEFLVNLYYNDRVKRIPLNYTTVFNKRMGLLYSNLPTNDQIGVSFDTYRVLASLTKDEDVPIWRIKVKVSNVSEIKTVAQSLRAQGSGIFTGVWDYLQLKNTIDKIDGILTTVTNILLGIVLSISFFSLLTTTYLNVVGQTNQIAILLILGYDRSRIARIYIYESLIVVLNSCIIGLVVGYLVAQMMGLQRQLFSQMPLDTQIRGVPLLLGMTLLSSCLSTYKPLRQIFNLSVSQILNYAK